MVVGAFVSVVSTSELVLDLAEAAASSAISLKLKVGEADLEVGHFVGVAICRGRLWYGVVSVEGHNFVLVRSLVVLVVFVRPEDTEVVAVTVSGGWDFFLAAAVSSGLVIRVSNSLLDTVDL